MALPANNPLPISATEVSPFAQARHGSGEMARLIQAFDWATTPLGAMDGWPQSMKSAVHLMLASKTQIVLFAGPEFTTLYNDAYIVVFGAKHPGALGTPGRICWSEIWDDLLGPLLKGVVATGEAFWGQDYPFILERHGFAEETYFDVSYDPVRDESGKAAHVICLVSETTKRVLSERRLKILREMGSYAAKTAEEACQTAANVLSNYSADLPFALIYLLDESGRQARLVASSGIEPASDMAALLIEVSAENKWPLSQVLTTGQPALVEQLSSRFRDIPPGKWPDPPHTALVLPILAPGRSRTIGFLIAGVSIRLALDDEYRNFFELVVGHIASAIANARAHEEERKRVEALAAIDRAKTEFFSNVSHEFRTPLTLMLNPLQEVLSDPALSSQQRENLEVTHRNSLRLLKLVNTLLDFSRIQSDRIRASFEPTDLAALTVDLASNFWSLIERAGLHLVIDCPPLSMPVYVDHEMWEKIVLNLISNAFKFTFEGTINVSLHSAGDQVELKVQDTGIGIAEADLPHLFERFHRIRGARSRTYEGSGIGLALVAELVRLHGGQITAASTPNVGTTFTISIPLGTAHLPPDQIGTPRELASTAIGAESYTEEAQRWLMDAGQTAALPAADSAFDTAGVEATAPEQAADVTMFIVDDNADMLDYLRRLLGQRYRIEVAKDGLTALAQIQQRLPDLVIADVMMPGIDGLELIRQLQANVQTRAIPVILLSARAGEEARIEGARAGANVYLAKPFSARELLARVESQLQLAHVRREAEERLRTLYEAERQARQEAEEANALKIKFLGMISHELRTPLASIKGFSSTLLATDVSFSADSQHQFIDIIDQEADKLTALVEQLLDLSRLQAGTLRIEPIPQRLDTILKTVLPQLQMLTVQHRLGINYPDNLPLVYADSQRIAQVLANLVGNAVKFSPLDSPITIQAAQAGQYLQIDVCDEGIGIPTADREIVFEAFRQVDRKNPGQRLGAGLGLAICKSIIEAHHGRIWVQDQAAGTIISFVLQVV